MAHLDREPLSRRTALRGAALLGAGAPLLAACADADQETSTVKSGAPTTDFATTADVPEGSGKIYADQGVVVTQPSPGEFQGFTNICTHQGCPVSEVTDTINCTCHGSKFSIADGSVVEGPAPKPLAARAVDVVGENISLA